MRQKIHRGGFTLVELLVTMAIIALLAVVVLTALPMARQRAYCSGCLANMHSLSLGFMLYANDNDGQLPGRATGDGVNKWPVLLLPYVGDPKKYIDPGDPVAVKVATQDLVSNGANNSSFFFNGFNDLGAYANPGMTVHMINISNPPNTILLGQKVHGSTQYYMDFVEGNENDVLNKTAYFGGSNYGFADGSVRFMLPAAYNDQMWLVNPSYQIP